MTAGAKIAGRIGRGLARAGKRAGSGPFVVTLVQSSGGPQSPWETGGATETSTPLHAVVGHYTQNMIDGTLVRSGDVRLFTEAGSVEPTTADRVTISGADYAIVSVRPIAPGGVALMWELQCRR